MPTKQNSKQNGLLPKILILAGVVVLVIMIFAFKNQATQSAVSADKSLEARFDRYIKEGRPTLAFFHSTNCHSCIVMMDIVAQVYPEFKDSVALVDVDVYDSQNENLLRRAGINSIPTLVFIDRKGQRKVSIGVIDAAQLRRQLQILDGTP